MSQNNTYIGDNLEQTLVSSRTRLPQQRLLAILNPNNCSVGLIRQFYSCPPYYFPPLRRTFSNEIAFYQLVSLLAHNLLVLQFLHLVWLAFVKSWVQSFFSFGLNLDSEGSGKVHTRAVVEAKERVGYDTFEFSQEASVKLKQIEEKKQETLLYFSFRALVIGIISRMVVLITRFFILNYFKLVKASPLLVQVVRNEAPLFILWAQLLFIQSKVRVPPQPEKEELHDQFDNRPANSITRLLAPGFQAKFLSVATLLMVFQSRLFLGYISFSKPHWRTDEQDNLMMSTVTPQSLLAAYKPLLLLLACIAASFCLTRSAEWLMQKSELTQKLME